MSRPNAMPDAGHGAGDLGLDARIAAAEAVLVAREERLRRRSRALVQRVEQGIVRGAGSGIIVALAALAVAVLLKRRRPAAEAARTEAAAKGAGTGAQAGAWLVSLIPLVWPLLPRAWRRILSLETATAAVTAAAPLLARLFRRRPRPAGT